jgi:hypothetical protein
MLPAHVDVSVGPSVSVFWPMVEPSALRPAFAAQEGQRRSTGLERGVAGSILGMGSLALMALMTDSDTPGLSWIIPAVYSAGTVAGISMATARLEGARPGPVTLGAVAGTLPWMLLVLRHPDWPGDPGMVLPLGLMVLLSPTLGSLAHGLSVR